MKFSKPLENKFTTFPPFSKIFCPRGWFALPDEDVLVLKDVDTLVERLDRFELGPDLSLNNDKVDKLGPQGRLEQELLVRGRPVLMVLGTG